MKATAENITVKVVWQAMTNVFQEAGLDTPVADARLLVQHALGMTHEDMLMNGQRPVSVLEQARIENVMNRRLKHEPVSRITGMRAFWKSDFVVTPDTLDPRHDSETLIEAALEHVKFPARILDCGTGTGCLLLSLLQEWNDVTGTGIDISAGAVATARHNAERLGLSSRAGFVESGWESFSDGNMYDVIISNPPYIALHEREALAPDVRDYDPPQALFGGADGLDAYRSLIAALPKFAAPASWVVFEIGHTQAGAVGGLLAKAGLHVIQTRTDLAGHDRVIVAKWLV